MYNKSDIDRDAEREGQALNRARTPQRNSQHHNRLRLRTSEGKDKFEKLFRN